MSKDYKFFICKVRRFCDTALAMNITSLRQLRKASIYIANGKSCTFTGEFRRSGCVRLALFKMGRDGKPFPSFLKNMRKASNEEVQDYLRKIRATFVNTHEGSGCGE